MQRGKRISFLMVLSCVSMLCFSGCNQAFEEILQQEIQINQNNKADKEYTISFESESPSTFAYDRLSETEKMWYRDINKLLSYRMDESVELSMVAMQEGLTDVDIDRIYSCVMMDHPEYFYVDGYEYVTYVNGLGETQYYLMYGKYTYSQEECESRKAQLDEAVEDILWLAPTDEDDYEKIRYVYETIIKQTDYDLNAPDNQNIYSVLMGKASVCQGYAKTTQYLLNKLGINCSIVFGNVRDGEPHSWNIVECNDAYYFLDTTWGDASYSMNGEAASSTVAPEISYDYLCIDSEQLNKTHHINEVVDLPECDSMDDNYYVREGKYFYDYDEEQLEREFEESFSAEESCVTIKCDTQEVYEEFYEQLIENQLIFSYLSSDYESISYVDDDTQLTLSFWVTK